MYMNTLQSKHILLVSASSTKHIERFTRFLHNTPKNVVIDFLDSGYGSKAKLETLEVDNFFYTKAGGDITKKIPVIRVIVLVLCQMVLFFKVLLKHKYDLINVHNLPFYSIGYVLIAKICRVPVMLTPWGSDVLRVPVFFKFLLKCSFRYCTYVSGPPIDFTKKIQSIYGYKAEKLVCLKCGSETISAMKDYTVKGKLELANALKIPRANYYITCGYTASHAQNHIDMICAIAANKMFLPTGTLLLFPFSYGADKCQKYVNELRDLCHKNSLECVFITDYLPVSDVAKLRYVSDLFIHIQPTDAYSASLREYLLSGCLCINGGWLKYPTLELYGKPYIVCDSIGDLAVVLKKIFTGNYNKPILADEIRREILSDSWDNVIKEWVDFYENI